MSIKFKVKLLNTNNIITSIPGDKSISHRAIIIGSLASNNSIFDNFLCAEDCLNTAKIFKSLGVNLTVDTMLKKVSIQGVGLNGLQKSKSELHVGNSGTGIRLITGILAAQNFKSVITGDHSIVKRPMKRIIDPLTKMSATITGEKLTHKKDIYPPLIIEASQLKAIKYTLPVASAQVKSALLFASLFAFGTTAIHEPIACRNHTEVMLKTFGANINIKDKIIYCDGTNELKNPYSTAITIPSDFSSAAFFIVLGLIYPNSDLTITNVGLNPTRATLINVLKKMGADITIDQKEGIEPFGDIRVKTSELHNITVPVEDIPFIIDEIPILAVAAMFAKGKMIIKDAEELRVKESDRIKSIVKLVQQFGASIIEKKDGFTLTGGFNAKSPKINTYYDHRIRRR